VLLRETQAINKTTSNDFIIISLHAKLMCVSLKACACTWKLAVACVLGCLLRAANRPAGARGAARLSFAPVLSPSWALGRVLFTPACTELLLGRVLHACPRPANACACCAQRAPLTRGSASSPGTSGGRSLHRHCCRLVLVGCRIGCAPCCRTCACLLAASRFACAWHSTAAPHACSLGARASTPCHAAPLTLSPTRCARSCARTKGRRKTQRSHKDPPKTR